MQEIDITTLEGFNTAYIYNLGAIFAARDPAYQAYLMTEEQHKAQVGAYKYSNYESFRVNRSKYMAKILGKK